MRHSGLAVRVALLIVSIVASTELVQAQYRTSIQGVVTDNTGAVIPGATLTLTNPATNETQVRTSDDSGVFNFNALPASVKFRLEADKTGFAKKVINNIDLIPDQANALNVQMDLGATAQTVTVNAEYQPAMDTETASINGVVSSNQVQHLPSLGRDVLKLATLAPGSFGDNSQASGTDNYNLPGTQTGGGQSGGADGIFKTENGAQVIGNGNQTENNGISIDGISTTSAVWGGSTVVTPSEDSVESVKIVSNSYDSEDGRFTGSQIQITSKSGTNNFHGSLFFTTHQPNLNAYQPYNGNGNNKQRDNSKFNQFGGSVGGPIWKNKLFFFFNYETVREPHAAVVGTQWYETPSFDASAPAGSIAAKYLSFPGNNVVALGINPNADCTTAGLVQGVNCNFIPGQGLDIGSPLTTPLGTQDLTWTSVSSPGVGNGLDGAADIADYITLNPTTFNAAQYNGRLDADVTGKDRIGFAIYWVPLSQTKLNGNRAYDVFHHSQINDAFSAIWNHTFSPTFLNELRANAAGWRWNEIADNPQSPVGFPTDTIGQIGSITPGSFGPRVGSILDQWTYTYKDVATKIIGRNTIKFGGEVTRLFYLQNNVTNAVPSYGFYNLWDFLNDAPSNEGGNYLTFDPHTGFPTPQRQDDRENILGFFVQDDLKVRPNLTLNIGLRYSYFGPLYSKENNMYVADPGAGANYMTGLIVHKDKSWVPQKDNLGPEFGFAWSPTRYNNRLVIRGGYGLNYNGEEIAISSNIVANPGLIVAPYFGSSSPESINPNILYALSSSPHNLYGYPSNPAAITSFGPNGLPTTGSANVGIFPHVLPTMRTHHYSLDMQYDIGHQWVMSLGYQGNLARNLYFHESPNVFPATHGYPLNPQIGCCDYWGVNGYGNYNAMLAEVKHQFSHQFMADAQFAWSKSMDTSSAPYSEQFYPYDLNLDYGRSDYNVGKAFKLFGMWQPVFFHGNNWVEKVVGGWSLSGILNVHSGFPWSPTVSAAGGSLYCGSCGYSQLYPAAYLGGAGDSTSNDAFKTEAASNFPKGGAAYFTTPTYTVYNGSASGGTSGLPQNPGVARNSFTGPIYRDLDLTVAKAFGLPNMPVLGESARIELRMDAYNVFNTLNFNENTISNNINVSNFGTYQFALTGRVLQLGARFSF